MPILRRQTTFGPSLGQGVISPFSGETLVPSGPRNAGQSLPSLRWAATVLTTLTRQAIAPATTNKLHAANQRMGHPLSRAGFFSPLPLGERGENVTRSPVL